MSFPRLSGVMTRGSGLKLERVGTHGYFAMSKTVRLVSHKRFPNGGKSMTKGAKFGFIGKSPRGLKVTVRMERNSSGGPGGGGRRPKVLAQATFKGMGRKSLQKAVAFASKHIATKKHLASKKAMVRSKGRKPKRRGISGGFGSWGRGPVRVKAHNARGKGGKMVRIKSHTRKRGR